MAGEKILIVEDDLMIQDALAYSLGKEGFIVVQAFDGQQGIDLARDQKPDLVLLDLMLPLVGGLEVCREIRRDNSVPILMVTARSEETDRVVGLELGADDYIIKPFGTRELIARIRSNLRRVGFADNARNQSWTIGPVRLDLDRREVFRDETLVHLSYREFELLLALADAKGSVVPRDRLLEKVWGLDWIGDPRTLDVHIRWLREKLENSPSDPRLILTVRNVGYRMVTAEECR